ncbi:MAG TPA: glycosyltransferase, partial [Burkholderiales bacterium]|nr:glycosyltransferase [Burkholderiales bacterium]
LDAKKSDTLNVLFVGGLSQGKGLSYLFGAADLLRGRISLTVIGRRRQACPVLDRQLEQCRYIESLPNADVLSEMRRHDVLVFPSLWDGFGLVILEAMSQGIPVIASTNCGGPDVITDGEDGFIVPIRATQTIAEKLELLADDPDLLLRMKAAAHETAERYSWERYRSSLVENVV